MRIVPVACLEDNYAYLVVCEATNTAAVVDPSESGPVLEAVAAEGVELKAVWNTHHHWDHTGGNKGLLDELPELAVIAHSSDKGRVPGQTTFGEEGDEVTMGSEIKASLIHNPGHTTGAISFYIESYPAVFTGDTLFGAGCGRLFEGTPSQMHESLSKLGALPDNTLVYCGHEYTANNLKFAIAVEPNNEEIARRAELASRQRADGKPTVPFTMADEHATNPFMRTGEAAVIAAARANEPPGDESPAEILGSIRRWKDRF